MWNWPVVDTDTVAPRVLCAVRGRSSWLPRSTFPKSTVPGGLTVNSSSATALATGVEQALSSLLEFTAVTEAKYKVPVPSPVSLTLRVWSEGGLEVGDATSRKEGPGHGGSEVP
jgi:hypothetical protein